MLELYVAPQLEEFQPWIIFPTRCTSTLGFTCSSVFGCNISKQVDWEKWSDTLVAGYHAPPLDFFLLGYVKDKVFSTPVPDITNLNARITDAFATITEDMLGNTWRETDCRLDVLRATKGAQVEVYWCVVKKTLELCLYSTYSSFPVINVRKQGKTLCSHCISVFLCMEFVQIWSRRPSTFQQISTYVPGKRLRIA